VRGKALGETRLLIASKDGHRTPYRVVVQAVAGRLVLGSLNSR
jgi:hypothetical protein